MSLPSPESVGLGGTRTTGGLTYQVVAGVNGTLAWGAVTTGTHGGRIQALEEGSSLEMTLAQAQEKDLQLGQRIRLTDYADAPYEVVDVSDNSRFSLPLNASQKLRIDLLVEYTLEMFGADGVDDTAAIQGASSMNASLNLGSNTYIYKAASEVGTTELPRVIRGEGWTIHCEGAVALQYRNNTYFTGGQFTSDNTFLVDATVPRSSAASSVMLLTNSETTTNIKMYVDFEYTTASNNQRGEGFIRDTTTGTTLYDIRSNQVGCVIGTWLSQTGGKVDGKLSFKNCETGLIKQSGMSEKLDLELVNTPAQMANFRNTTDTVPSKNGKDCILSEASGVKTPETNITMKSYYAIERGAYIQRSGRGVFDGYAYGSDVGKCTDDSEGLTVYATAHLVPDGSSEQRYAWQVYGGANGSCKDIDVWPVCHNRTGVTGNKECISVLGECENIVVHEPYGYDLGNGICLVQNFTSGIFAPRIDGLRFIGGRVEGPNGNTANNGALQLSFNTFTAGNYLRNVSVTGMSAMPAASGNTTFRFNGITERVNITDVKVDGVVSATDYDQQVVVFDCENATLTAQELYNTASQYPFIYPVAIQRTNLAVNSTQNIDLGNIAVPANPAVVHVELQASHNSQPAGNYIRYEADLIIGGAASQVVEITNVTATSQTLTLSFNHTTGDITLAHQSTSPLGFEDETFFAKVSSTKEITFT